MGRANPTVLFGFFVALIVAICGVSVLKGGLYLGAYEGDSLHMVQIVLRMADGEWPHLDFMSPLGVLAFAPIAFFVKLGFGVGMSFILGQALVIALLLPALWWTAYSRLRGKLAYLFGLFVIVLVAALVHGEAEYSISVSMHYNRWAWAIAFVAIALAVLPPLGAPRQTVDGVIIGLAMSVLLLMKVTYFAAFVPPIVLILLLRRDFRTVLAATMAGLSVILLVTALAGIEFWQRYLSDLLLVALGDVRAAPGATFTEIFVAPAYFAASIVLLGAVILLRQSKQLNEGLALLTLVPGFAYVTYQNFGNDPQWLLLLGVLLLALLPEREAKNSFGWDLRMSAIVSAAIAFALISPSFFNLAYSPFRHYGIATDIYKPMVPNQAGLEDIQVTKTRGFRVDGQIAMDQEGSGLEDYVEAGERIDPVTLKGEELAFCTVTLGYPVWFEAIAGDLETAGLAKGKRVFTTDIIASHWLYGSLLPAKHGAVWYYGGLPGIASADYVLVPLCPISQPVRDIVLQTIKERGIELTEVRRTPLYILFTHDKS